MEKRIARFMMEVDPQDALLGEVQRTAGVVSWLEYQIAELGSGPEVLFRNGEEHEYVRMWREERKHLARVSKDAVHAGIAERHVQLAENQGFVIANVVRGALGDSKLDISDSQRSQILGLVADGLRKAGSRKMAKEADREAKRLGDGEGDNGDEAELIDD